MLPVHIIDTFTTPDDVFPDACRAYQPLLIVLLVTFVIPLQRKVTTIVNLTVQRNISTPKYSSSTNSTGQPEPYSVTPVMPSRTVGESRSRSKSYRVRMFPTLMCCPEIRLPTSYLTIEAIKRVRTHCRAKLATVLRWNREIL